MAWMISTECCGGRRQSFVKLKCNVKSKHWLHSRSVFCCVESYQSANTTSDVADLQELKRDTNSDGEGMR